MFILTRPKHNYDSSINQLNNILINNGTFKGFNYDIAKTLTSFLQINTSTKNTNTMFSFRNFFLNFMSEEDQDQIQLVFKEDITGTVFKTNGAINGINCYTHVEMVSHMPFFNFSLKQTNPTHSPGFYTFNLLTSFSNLNLGVEVSKIKNDIKKCFLIEYNTNTTTQIISYQSDGYKYGMIKRMGSLELGMEWYLFKKFFFGAVGCKINTFRGWVKTEINSMLRLAVLIEQKLLDNLILSLSFESDRLKNIEMGLSLSLEF